MDEKQRLSLIEKAADALKQEARSGRESSATIVVRAINFFQIVAAEWGSYEPQPANRQ